MKKLSERFMYYSGILAAHGQEVVIEDLKHIQNLIDAEENGLLLMLPCKVGDTVYEIINCGKTCPILVIPTTFKLQDLPLFEKKRMFLTKEEAEAALQKMQEDRQ